MAPMTPRLKVLSGLCIFFFPLREIPTFSILSRPSIHSPPLSAPRTAALAPEPTVPRSVTSESSPASFHDQHHHHPLSPCPWSFTRSFLIPIPLFCLLYTFVDIYSHFIPSPFLLRRNRTFLSFQRLSLMRSSWPFCPPWTTIS